MGVGESLVEDFRGPLERNDLVRTVGDRGGVAPCDVLRQESREAAQFLGRKNLEHRGLYGALVINTRNAGEYIITVSYGGPAFVAGGFPGFSNGFFRLV